MRTAITILAIIFALFLVLVSALMNWRFGLSLGHTPLDAQIYGAASVAADGLKVLLPFFFYWAWRNGRILIAVVGCFVWTAGTAYSVTSALGFAALNRATVSGELATKSGFYADWKKDLERAQNRLAGLAHHRPPAVVGKLLAAQRQHRRWSTTKACTDVTQPKSRLFCMSYHNLEAEQANGEDAFKLQAQISSLRTKVQNVAGAANTTNGDPQARFIADLIQRHISEVQAGLIILIAGLVELGSSLGVFLATNHGELRAAPQTISGSVEAAAPDTPSRAGDVADFALARLKQAPGSTLDLHALYFAYHTWCSDEELMPLDTAAFTTAFEQLCDVVGVASEVHNGTLTCSDIRLAA